MKTRLFSILTALTFIMGSCVGDDTVNGSTDGGTVQPQPGMATFTSETSASADAKPLTRTTMKHSPYNGADVFWDDKDKIWVKDDNSTWNQSATADFSAYPTNKARATFALNGTYTGSTYSVAYTGSNGTSATQVTIANVQTQSAPNNFDHAGKSGDCGVATATGSAGAYSFKLAHKAAYLCFLPRCQNSYLAPNIRLTKIVVTSTSGNIAGTYDFSTGKLGTLVSGGSNSIELNITNFSLSNDYVPGSRAYTRTSPATPEKEAYMVIVPGNHTLNIDYHIEDPTTHTEGTIHKTGITLNCAEGTISDITAWIDREIRNYSYDYYHMWDAQQPYWKEHEWDKYPYEPNVDQPILNGQTGSSYPQSDSDSRWHNASTATPLMASNRCSICPNANEMSWYAMAGNPHWDNDELWTTMGHLYKGGMWLLRKEKILNFSKERSFDNTTDMRVTYKVYDNLTIAQGRPDNIDDYFYLPATGYSFTGKTDEIGKTGRYWSSTGYMDNPLSACDLYLSPTKVHVGNGDRRIGYKVLEFE